MRALRTGSGEAAAVRQLIVILCELSRTVGVVIIAGARVLGYFICIRMKFQLLLDMTF